jgi:hypothetical protein
LNILEKSRYGGQLAFNEDMSLGHLSSRWNNSIKMGFVLLKIGGTPTFELDKG